MSTLQEINSRIIANGNKLASEAKSAILEIVVNSPRQVAVKSQDDPSRPWVLGGVVCTAVGFIGLLASDSQWPYYIGALGLGSLAYGLITRNQQSLNNTEESPIFNSGEEKALIIDKCNNILDAKKREWDSFMASIKDEIQALIRNSSLSDDQKDEYMSYTYYSETLLLTTRSLIDKFDKVNGNSNFASQISTKKAEFASEVAAEIIKTATTQVQNYNKIAL